MLNSAFPANISTREDFQEMKPTEKKTNPFHVWVEASETNEQDNWEIRCSQKAYFNVVHARY